MKLVDTIKIILVKIILAFILFLRNVVYRRADDSNLIGGMGKCEVNITTK